MVNNQKSYSPAQVNENGYEILIPSAEETQENILELLTEEFAAITSYYALYGERSQRLFKYLHWFT